MSIYVKGEGPYNAKILLVGEAPGSEENRQGRPFVGAAGEELNAELETAGLLRSECRTTNVFRFQPPGNNLDNFVLDSLAKGSARGWISYEGRFVNPVVMGHIEDLFAEVRQTNPNVIVALGETAMWALTGKRKITQWAGSALPTHRLVRPDGRPYKVIPTLHPAGVLRQWSWRPLVVHDLRRVKRESQFAHINLKERAHLIRPSFEDTMSMLRGFREDTLEHPLRLAVDIETRGGHIACIALVAGWKWGISIPFMCVERPEGYWTLEEEQAIILELRRLLTDPDVFVIGHNFLYDMQYIAKWWGFAPHCGADTMLMQHVLFPDLRKALFSIARLYGEDYVYWKDDGKEWEKSQNEEQLWAYNAEDGGWTIECWRKMVDLIVTAGLERQLAFQMELFHEVFKMMLRGVAQDSTKKPLISSELNSEIGKRFEFLERVLGHPFNPRSPKQMNALFYNDFRCKPIKSPKTGGLTLDDDALELVARREPVLAPIVRAILETRSLTVFRSTFVEAQTDVDGRMRCSINVTGAKTLRFSTSLNAFGTGTNLQNLPKGTKIAQHVKELGPQSISELEKCGFKLADIDAEEDSGAIQVVGKIVYPRLVFPNVRSFFIPDPDHIIMEWDLERADLQVVVWEADDSVLKQILREGVDLHAENAKVLGCSRQMAKTFVHGTNYGGTARTMAKNCGVLVHQSELMQRRWFGAHPGIKTWHRRTEMQLATNRTITNRFGFRITFFDRMESLLPKALAWTPQSTVALAINIGLVEVAKHLPEVEFLLQVHDSLLLQVHKSHFPAIIPSIRKHIQVTIPYPDPLVIPTSCSWSDRSWGDAEPYKALHT